MAHIETGSFAKLALTRCPTELRVVSWNIARGSKLDTIIEFLASSDAGIILLQETDRNARRTNYQNVARAIAEKLRMHYVFGCEFEELAEGSRSSPAYHGQATLSRWPLSNTLIVPFDNQSNFWRPRWFIPPLGPLQRRRGERMALLNDVLIPGKNVSTYNLHCESKGGDILRYSQLYQVLQHAKRYGPDVPVLVAGDFNSDVSQGQAAVAVADSGFVNPFATLRQATTVPHPLSARARMIDWILLRGPAAGTKSQVHTSVFASDHYPLSLSVNFS